jgi:hypothetical protein
MSVEEPELAGFDGNAAVIEGGVPMHVYEEARDRRDRFKQEHPDSEVPDLDEFVSNVLGGS